MSDRLKVYLSLVTAIACIWLLSFMLKSYFDKDLRAADADRADAKAHRDQCVTLRVEFMKMCLGEHRGNTQCLIDWSQVRSQVFDSPPDTPWASEVNCSK